MQPGDIEKLFDSVALQSADVARERAKRAAMAAFEDIHAGTESVEHVTGDGDQVYCELRSPNCIDERHSGSDSMSVFKQRWIFSGIASAAVLVVVVSLGFNVLSPGPVLYDRAPQPVAVADFTRPEADVRVESERTVEALAVASAPRQRMPDASAGAPSLAEISIVPEQARSKGLAVADLMPTVPVDEGRDRFQAVEHNPVHLTREQPVSTFSADVDTASYSFVRRQLNRGVLPQKNAVRLEEMVNYFPYEYPEPANRQNPFAATVSVLDSPWREGNKLVHIGIRGYDIAADDTPDSNLVFLLDVSGSMNSPDKLPLVKQSMSLLLSRLKATDTVAIVVYAGAAGVVLEPTEVADRQTIVSAMQRLNAGGSTAGGAGIKAAYQLARSSFKEGAVNRVILATDGDFNVGIASVEELQGYIERQRHEGIYLTVLGFGQGNYHDHLMQALAQNGNGAAAYIDTLGEAQKVLVDEATSTLFPIAGDVKLQMEFNPDTVSEYRLLGYETRALKREDFNNDKVDAGDVGAGHSVTAIYEITPVGSGSGLVEPGRYAEGDAKAGAFSGEYGFLKIRYKLPGEDSSKLLSVPALVSGSERQAPGLAREIDFSVAVAGFAQLLSGGQYLGDWSYDDVIELAQPNRGDDPYGYRAEFLQLVRKAAIAEDLD